MNKEELNECIADFSKELVRQCKPLNLMAWASAARLDSSVSEGWAVLELNTHGLMWDANTDKGYTLFALRADGDGYDREDVSLHKSLSVAVLTLLQAEATTLIDLQMYGVKAAEEYASEGPPYDAATATGMYDR